MNGPQARLLQSSEEVDPDWHARVPFAAARLARTRGETLRPRPEPAPPATALLLGHGADRYAGQIVGVSDGSWLLLFEDGLPPPDRDLVILYVPLPRPPSRSEGTVCFTPGTQILTPGGTRPIEDLYPGDRVMTRDDGAQPIGWMGLRYLSEAALRARPALRPVRLRSGSLGGGDPAPDLVVSPDHRLLVTGPKARALWGDAEVLVRAADLIDDSRVIRDHGRGEVVYVHMLFSRHQVLWANGTPVESFHPADADLSRLNIADKEEVLEIAPGIDIDDSAYGAHARRCLSGAELALLRHDGAPSYLS